MELFVKISKIALWTATFGFGIAGLILLFQSAWLGTAQAWGIAVACGIILALWNSE